MPQTQTLLNRHIEATEIVRNRAKTYEPKGIKPRDALHLACAVTGSAEYFLTCDDRLLKKQRKLNVTLKILNPIDFIRR
jgi:predicted nucleic acid-binding protein